MTDKPLESAPLAYENDQFLNSPDGRVLRVLSEYIEPLARFRREQIQDTVVFFGSARIQSPRNAQQKLTVAQSQGVNVAPAQLASNMKRTKADLDMARYYEDARRLAYMLTE